MFNEHSRSWSIQSSRFNQFRKEDEAADISGELEDRNKIGGMLRKVIAQKLTNRTLIHKASRANGI